MRKIKFPIWRSDITIGLRPIEEIVAEVKKMGVEFNVWGEEIFSQTKAVPCRMTISLIKISLRCNDGLPIKSKLKSTRPMYEEAFERGYCLCPNETALYLFLQRKRKLLGSFYMGMRPVPCASKVTVSGFQDNILDITDCKHQFGHSQCIAATPANLDDFADGGMSYILCKATPELISLGYNKL